VIMSNADNNFIDGIRKLANKALHQGGAVVQFLTEQDGSHKSDVLSTSYGGRAHYVRYAS
jgi:hypothetical protein